LHAACTDEHTGVCLILTSAAQHDTLGFELVWHDLRALQGLDAAVMDKAYDSDAIRLVFHDQGVEAVTPGKTNRIEEIPYDKEQYTSNRPCESP
jgi:hypothetical protein